MRVFVTGATGFIGSAVVKELLGAGHTVLGLTRSDAGAEALVSAGAEVLRGDLNDLDSLRRGASQAEGVIHTAFDHDFSKFAANCEMDRLAIEAMGDALRETAHDRAFVVTSGTGMVAPGRMAVEDDIPSANWTEFPRVSEQAGIAFASASVRASVVRLPQVHDRSKQGFVSYLIEIARATGVSAYVAEGTNRWPAVHVLDAARLYRLAVEKGASGARYHAVAEEGVALREIAESIGRGLKVPVVGIPGEEAAKHFGFLGFFAGVDCPASSARTQERLGWRPTALPGMLDDLNRATAFMD